MSVERRGQAIRVMINLANWQQEEPTGCGGGRQPSIDGTSRVTGDSHARFCERLGVKLPGPTRLEELKGIRTTGDGIEIGAMTTLTEVVTHPVIRQQYSLLAEGAEQVLKFHTRAKARVTPPVPRTPHGQ